MTAEVIAHPKHLPVLDGLRFFAALLVVMSHYSHWVVADQNINDAFSLVVDATSALGMALFFVLSGFVIHYNYQATCLKPGGLKVFAVARFTRLYPLYFVLFCCEFATSFHMNRIACGQFAGDRWAGFLGLPYYFTMTQDWFYSVLCQRSLLVQYHMVSGVTWSVSLEMFFYVCYALFLCRFMQRRFSTRTWLLLAGLVQAVIVIFFHYCWVFQNQIDTAAVAAFGPIASAQVNYENSLQRWLLYFNPVMNLGAFFFGVITAHIYMKQRNKPLTATEKRWGAVWTFLSIATLLGVHFYIYRVLAPTDGFYGRTGSAQYAPLVAPVIYCLVRYRSLWARMISRKLLVKLGEASYSIYLLHALFAWNGRDFYDLGLYHWLLWALMIVGVLVISRFSYLYFERPVQRFLRKRMLKTP